MFYDVNADHNITAADALGVINSMSRGEEVGELVELILTARDLDDNPIAPDANGEINVAVDQFFDLEVSYDDLRTFSNRRGVFQLYTDLLISQPGVLSPVLNETQRLVIDSTIETVASDSVTFTIPTAPPGVTGGVLSYVSPINDFANSQSGEIANALMAFGYTAAEFEITDVEIQGDLGFDVHWVGDAFGNVNLPNISVDVNESSGSPEIPTQTIEFAPFLADGVTPNSAAVRFNIDARSRTFGDGVNDELYVRFPRGQFDSATGFTEIGGLVDNIGATSIADLNNGSFDEPFDAFSFRVFVNQPVTDLVVSLTPNDGSEATLLFGRDDPVPPDLVLLETVDSTTIQRPATSGIAQVTINTIDVGNPGTLNIAATATVNEGDGNATVRVTRTGGSSGAVSVGFATTGGTAISGTDFTATNGVLDFADGELFKDITVPITDDAEVESAESFTITLSNATGGASIGTATSTVTISDNDAAQQPGTLAISPATTSVNEGDGTVTLTVSRTGGSDGIVSVNVATANGTATAGSDYTALSSTTLTFADGDTTPKIVTVSIIDDVLDEGNETFTVDLSGVTGGASLGTATSTVTIVDDDGAQAGTLSIAPATTSVNEGDWHRHLDGQSYRRQ